MDTTTPARRPEVLGPGVGHHLHFLGHLATIRVSGEAGALSVVEFQAARGIGAPRHLHDDEDELFLVQEGTLVFHVGDVEHPAGPGGLAYLPAGIEHTFQVHSTHARFTCVTASRTASPRFDRMVRALGEPTPAPTLPEPAPIDPGHVAQVCADHGVRIVGPPPAPLP